MRPRTLDFVSVKSLKEACPPHCTLKVTYSEGPVPEGVRIIRKTMLETLAAAYGVDVSDLENAIPRPPPSPPVTVTIDRSRGPTLVRTEVHPATSSQATKQG